MHSTASPRILSADSVCQWYCLEYSQWERDVFFLMMVFVTVIVT